MFLKPMFRLVPDNTRIKFMRGRFAGLIVSAVLSTASVVLFFYPGLNLGIDFRGGIVMEVRTPEPADFAKLRAGLAAQGITAAGLQRFGDDHEVLIRLDRQPTEAGTEQVVARVRDALAEALPGTTIQRTDAVGASVSDELFRNGTTTAVAYGSVHAASADALFAEADRRGACMIAPGITGTASQGTMP